MKNYLKIALIAWTTFSIFNQNFSIESTQKNLIKHGGIMKDIKLFFKEVESSYDKKNITIPVETLIDLDKENTSSSDDENFKLSYGEKQQIKNILNEFKKDINENRSMVYKIKHENKSKQCVVTDKNKEDLNILLANLEGHDQALELKFKYFAINLLILNQFFIEEQYNIDELSRDLFSSNIINLLIWKYSFKYDISYNYVLLETFQFSKDEEIAVKLRTEKTKLLLKKIKTYIKIYHKMHNSYNHSNLDYKNPELSIDTSFIKCLHGKLINLIKSKREYKKLELKIIEIEDIIKKNEFIQLALKFESSLEEQKLNNEKKKINDQLKEIKSQEKYVKFFLKAKDEKFNPILEEQLKNLQNQWEISIKNQQELLDKSTKDQKNLSDQLNKWQKNTQELLDFDNWNQYQVIEKMSDNMMESIVLFKQSNEILKKLNENFETFKKQQEMSKNTIKLFLELLINVKSELDNFLNNSFIKYVINLDQLKIENIIGNFINSIQSNPVKNKIKNIFSMVPKRFKILENLKKEIENLMDVIETSLDIKNKKKINMDFSKLYFLLNEFKTNMNYEIFCLHIIVFIENVENL